MSEWTGLLLLAAVITTVISLAAWLYRERELARLRATAPPSATSRDSAAARLDPGRVLEMADWLGLGLLRIDDSGRVSRANESAHRILDRPDGALHGMSTMEAFVDHRIEEMALEAAANGSAQRELSFGGEPPLTLMIRARREADRSAVWMVLQDISELRRLQRIRAEFIDNLSHELRTPLTTVRLLTETLVMEMERTELPPQVRDAILKIDLESGHLAQMVSELLDLARIEQGGAPLRLAPVDLGRVVEATTERLQLYAGRHGVRLRREVPPDRGARTVEGDEERLVQVLINLVDNAVRYSSDGDEVVVRVRPAGTEVVLEVEDEGIGIPRTELDRIFERFYKVDRARQRSRGGTGLGLAIARHVVERHGGRISVESAEGVGSRFIVALPARAGSSAAG